MKNIIFNFPLLKKLFQEFIDYRWILAFIVIPAIIFIWDINIEYFWLILYYITFIFLVVSGFFKFVKDKTKS